MRTVAELLRLDERVAIVTGGAGHLALAIEETLLELGARIVVSDREGAALENRVALLRRDHSDRVVAAPADLSDGGQPSSVIEAALERFGRLDVLVNNAAFTGASGLRGYAVPFGEQTVEAWDAALRVNLTAVFQLCRAAEPHLSKSNPGVILNISSIYGIVGPNMSLYEGTPMGNPAAYAASKGGLIQLTRYLATVLAPRVRVNAISPGGIEREQPAVFHDRYCDKTPLRRMAYEEDFKGAVALLVSDSGAYITGQNLVVDGGWSSW
ncbi:MAG: SDR family oxidoreductase [Polyangiaceae bacterium]